MNDPSSISLPGLAVKKLRQSVSVLKEDWRRTLPFLFIIMAAVTAAVMIFQGGIAGAHRISQWPEKGGFFGFINNLWPYVVITQDHYLDTFKGLQFLRFFGTTRETGTAFLAVPLYFIFPAFLTYLIMRIKAGRLITGLLKLPVRLIRSLTAKEQGSQSYGVAMALLLSFLVLNPLTIVILALWSLLSLSNQKGSGLMFFFAVTKTDLNRLRGLGHLQTPVTGSVGGFAIGMLIAVPAILFTWFLCDYRMWSRIVFLLLPAAALFLGPFIKHLLKKEGSKEGAAV
jgi:hypothetical protein